MALQLSRFDFNHVRGVVEHQNAENTDVGVIPSLSITAFYDTFANGANLVSQTITTTKRCLIVVVTTCVPASNKSCTQIQRGGVDKTLETTISAAGFAVNGKYGHLQYTTEILDSGTYTYDLVNASGANLDVYGSTMKIVAVSVL